MAFFDEGTPRWEKCVAGGTGGTAVGTSTKRYSLLVGSQPNAKDKYTTVALTNTTSQKPYGVLDQEGADENATMDPYTLESNRKCRVKRSEKLRVRGNEAYAVAKFGMQIKPTATAGVAEAVASGGFGKIVGGESVTVDGTTEHYFDFWIDEADWQ